jgi:hypothetical protein
MNNIIAHTKYQDFKGTASLDFVMSHLITEQYLKAKGIDTSLYNLVGFELNFGSHGDSFSLKLICKELRSEDEKALVAINVEEKTFKDFLNAIRGFEIRLYNTSVDGFSITKEI